jgi:divalent metal cation (Fe/Co/Zn/Cd) transporter
MEKKIESQLKSFEKKHHIISALLLGAAIILFWRGIWMLADEFLFPSISWLSAIIGLLIGIIILYARGFHLRELF